MNMAETEDGKQTRQQIYDRGKRSDPFLWITEHGSNWKQTSKAHPPSSPHAQLHPQQSISIFASLTMPFEIAFSKQMESLGQMGGKQITEVRVRGAGVHLSKAVEGTDRSAVEAVRFRVVCLLRIVLLNVPTSTQCPHLWWLCCSFPYPDLAPSCNDKDLVIAHERSQNISEITTTTKFQPHFSKLAVQHLKQSHPDKRNTKDKTQIWQDSPQQQIKRNKEKELNYSLQ